MLVLGAILATWVAYNLFIDLRPGFADMTPAPAIIWSMAMLELGFDKVTNGKFFLAQFWEKQAVRQCLFAAVGLLIVAYIFNTLHRLLYTWNSWDDYLQLILDVLVLYILGKLFLGLYQLVRYGEGL